MTDQGKVDSSLGVTESRWRNQVVTWSDLSFEGSLVVCRGLGGGCLQAGRSGCWWVQTHGGECGFVTCPMPHLWSWSYWWWPCACQCRESGGKPSCLEMICVSPLLLLRIRGHWRSGSAPLPAPEGIQRCLRAVVWVSSFPSTRLYDTKKFSCLCSIIIKKQLSPNWRTWRMGDLVV